MIKDQVTALRAHIVGEEYIFFGSSRVDGVVQKIKAAQPDVVLSSVVGDSNLAFYQRLREAGLRPETTPVISFSVGEDELRKLSPREMAGNYAAWNYFQSIPRKENEEFVARFQKRYGADRVVNDVTSAAYNCVQLWAQAVREAGTTDIPTVRVALRHQSLNAPEGVISIDPATQHTWRPVYIGKMRLDGQFDIAWSSQKPVRPVPYPLSRSRTEWDAFLLDLYRQWNGNWANPRDETTTGPGP
jgi:urea transport system substrate-binding protein